MARRMAFGLVVVALVAVGGWALAQQQPAPDSGKTAAAAGRFTVSPAGNNGAILVDTATGKTWIMHHSADKTRPSVWLPMERLAGDDVQKWFAQEAKLREEFEQRRLDEEAAKRKAAIDAIKVPKSDR